MNPGAILERLGIASRRGRLAGYRNHGEPGGILFSTAAFGHPFDGVLEARVEPIDHGIRLRFSARLAPRMPILFAAGLALTVWPGVYFMDQLMIEFLPGVRAAVPTWWWYVPLTVVPVPWLWRATMRRTRAAIHSSARQVIARMAGELDGRLVADR